MKINNITNCCKPNPRGLTSFGSHPNSQAENNKGSVRYKHYEQMNDDVLMSKCIIKAHENVKNSSKMRLYKAIPSITTGVIATGIAITQPGKLAAKAASGLGFLALNEAYNAFKSHDDKKHQDNSAKSEIVPMAKFLAGTVGACALLKGVSNIKYAQKAVNFVSKESAKLANEINSTKLASFVEKTISPVIDKHPKLSTLGLLAGSMATIVGSNASSIALLKGMSKDIKQQANDNFEKAKTIQQIARNHFESVDAIEV